MGSHVTVHSIALPAQAGVEEVRVGMARGRHKSVLGPYAPALTSGLLCLMYDASARAVLPSPFPCTSGRDLTHLHVHKRVVEEVRATGEQPYANAQRRAAYQLLKRYSHVQC
jgi:hypothetical protein